MEAPPLPKAAIPTSLPSTNRTTPTTCRTGCSTWHTTPEITGFSNPPLNPSQLSGFDGMNFLDSSMATCRPIPTSPSAPSSVVETVNAQIQFYDKATGAALLPNTPL